MTFYTRRNAIVNYRGPELAQYARTLTLAAQYVTLTGDEATVLKHSKKLLDISAMLLERRRKAQQLPRSDPSYGLIRGEDESDELFSGWREGTSELPHFSFSLEAWRGFRDIGALWSRLGKKHARADLSTAGAALTNETASILADVQHGMLASAVPASQQPGNNATDTDVCHPYVAGEPSCEDMSTANVSGTSGPYNGRASEPWRSYSGMLYSGAVDSKTVGEIVTYNQNHSKLSHLGIWSGVRHMSCTLPSAGLSNHRADDGQVGGFRNQFMSFTEQGHGYGLVQHDFATEFLLQLYAEM